MNPEIAKYWNKALKNYDDAKDAFKRGQSDTDIKKMLWMAIVNGQFMTSQLETGGGERLIAAGTAMESLNE